MTSTCLRYKNLPAYSESQLKNLSLHPFIMASTITSMKKLLHLSIFTGIIVILSWNISTSHALGCPANSVNHLQSIREEILLKLGLSEEPLNPTNGQASPKLLEEYEAVQKLQELEPKESKPCVNLDFHTQKITPFSPVTLQRLRPLNRTAAGHDCASEFFMHINRQLPLCLWAMQLFRKDN